jgi:hypothetical protein
MKDKEMGKVKDKPLTAYINAIITNRDYTRLTDMEADVEILKDTIRGMVEYLQYKFREDK